MLVQVHTVELFTDVRSEAESRLIVTVQDICKMVSNLPELNSLLFGEIRFLMGEEIAVAKALLEAPALSTLTIANCEKFATNEVLTTLSGLSTLTNLDISGSARFPDSNIRAICSFSTLTRLNLAGELGHEDGHPNAAGIRLAVLRWHTL